MRDLLEAWADIEAVDHHCHPLWRFTHPVTAADLRMLFTEALDGAMARHVPSTAVYHDEAVLRLMLEGVGVTSGLPGAAATAPNMNELFQ